MTCLMSSTYAEPLDRMRDALDELAAISPEFRSTEEKREFLLGISRLISRAKAERMRAHGHVVDASDP